MPQTVSVPRLRRGLTDTALKWIALGAMVLDHIQYFFGYTGLVPPWFSMVGRLAAPLFLFCLVEGFVHTRSRKRYWLKLMAVAVPMGLLLFCWRFAGLGRRPDGMYPENSMVATFVLLFYFFQAFSMLGSKQGKKMALGALLLAGLLAWPFLAAVITMANPYLAAVVGVLGYTVLPVMNLTGDLGLPLILLGLALYLTRKRRWLQMLALLAVTVGWHFGFVYSQLQGTAGFALSQMFTTYYEWLAGPLALPFLLCYNGRRGAGHGKVFYLFYPAHIYLLYILSWLAMARLG